MYPRLPAASVLIGTFLLAVPGPAAMEGGPADPMPYYQRDPAVAALLPDPSYDDLRWPDEYVLASVKGWPKVLLPNPVMNNYIAGWLDENGVFIPRPDGLVVDSLWHAKGILLGTVVVDHIDAPD